MRRDSCCPATDTGQPPQHRHHSRRANHALGYTIVRYFAAQSREIRIGGVSLAEGASAWFIKFSHIFQYLIFFEYPHTHVCTHGLIVDAGSFWRAVPNKAERITLNQILARQWSSVPASAEASAQTDLLRVIRSRARSGS